MTRHFKPIVTLLFLALLAWGCTDTSRNNDHAAIPLPPAYVRIEPFKADYISTGQSGFEANRYADATVTQKENGIEWITLAYKQFGATLHVSYHPGLSQEKAEEMWLNRIDRMRINSGGRQSEILTADTPAGWNLSILITPQGSPTPVQFVATGMRDGKPAILTGGVNLGITPASADSISPVIRMFTRDIIHAVNAMPYD
ncbi:MAG: hypothetical protein K2M05_04120 [Paramuribaculum sp.]|nr:hypothetical protein [Paramuribaculum sp.]MDE6304904.1 hypothetical protein [Paramuribaculum sp.]